MSFLLAMLGFGKAVGQWLSHRSLVEIACLALAIVCAVEFAALKSEQRHAHKVETQLSKCTAAREADRQAYQQAQAEAAAKNRAHVAQVEAQQKRISDETVASLNDRLSRLSGELRARGPAAQSPPDGAGSSALSKPAGGTPEAPGLCLSPEQLLRAAEDEERHDQLITWIEQQLKVDPN